MGYKEIKPGIYWVGAIDWDRRIFDELVSTPHGTSYNAYIIKDEKTVLIDTVEPYLADTLINNIEDTGVEKVDYIISNHAEQDHSGVIPILLNKYPDAKIVTNQKCKELLVDHLDIPEDRFIVVNDQEEISIGKRTLKFFLTPWVHWPETMSTYIPEDDIIFTCDLFGAHLATSEIFSSKNWSEVEIEVKRYYAEIMMPFRKHIQKYIKLMRKLKVDMIAPSHGPVHDDIETLLKTYERWVSDESHGLVIIAYISMHGSTYEAVKILEKELLRKNVKIKIFNLTKTDPGEFAMALVDASTIVFATPTVLSSAHPAIIYFAHLTKALRPKLQYLSIINSYGWGGLTIKQIEDILALLNLKKLPYVTFKGKCKADTIKALEALADEIEKTLN